MPEIPASDAEVLAYATTYEQYILSALPHENMSKLCFSTKSYEVLNKDMVYARVFLFMEPTVQGNSQKWHLAPVDGHIVL